MAEQYGGGRGAYGTEGTAVQNKKAEVIRTAGTLLLLNILSLSLLKLCRIKCLHIWLRRIVSLLSIPSLTSQLLY